MADLGELSTDGRTPLQCAPFFTVNEGSLSVTFPEREGNAFHLCIIIRKFTAAKVGAIEVHLNSLRV